MATGTRKRYNLVSGTLNAALGLSGGSQTAFYDGAASATGTTLSATERGYEFSCDASGVRAVGVRLYYAQTTSVVVNLWSVTTQTIIASKTVSAVTDTWVEALFDIPVDLASGENYIISIEHVSGIMKHDTAAGGDFLSVSYLTYVTGRVNGNGSGVGLFPSATVANAVYGIADVLTDQPTFDLTVDFGTDPGFATLGANEYVPLTVGDSEIVHLTDFTAGATTGTVERAQEGTVAGDHAAGADWVHGPTTQDFEVDELVGYDLLASRLLDVEDVGTATYTVVANDTGKVKRCTVDCTVTLPAGLPIGTVVEIMAFSAGGITVQAGAGATVQGAGTVAQYASCSVLCVEADTWIVTGAT